MSTSAGPGSITNGLVFAYDMGNNSKSFIGAPTTNLAEFPATGYNWVNSGAANYSDNDTNEQLPNVPNNRFFTSLLRVVSCQTTTASSQGQQCGYAFTSVSGSTQYTMSLWFKKNRDDMGSYGPYVRQSVNNNWHGTFDYNGETNNALWPTNKWIRIQSTFTTSSNENGVYLSNYIGSYVGDKVCYAGGQLEQKSFATGLAQGTRSNTQALLDLTGRNTITTSSLTYASNNTFTFNASSTNYMTGTMNSAFHPSTNSIDRSWEVFVKPTTSQSWAGLFGHVVSGGCSYYCNGGVCIASGNYQFNWYDNSSYQFLDSGVAATSGQWAHVIGTYTSSDNKTRIYVNGVLKATYGSTTNLNYGGYAYYYQLGYLSASGNYYTGDTAVAKYYYNKALTAAEVQQNFNALRSRYGI